MYARWNTTHYAIKNDFVDYIVVEENGMEKCS